MNRPDLDKPSPVREPPKSTSARLEEARQIIKEYADELRELIRKLRQRLHQGSREAHMRPFHRLIHPTTLFLLMFRNQLICPEFENSRRFCSLVLELVTDVTRTCISTVRARA
jgi:hypothetical protein